MKNTYHTIYYENDDGESIEFKFMFNNDEEALNFSRTWLRSYVAGLPGHNWAVQVKDTHGEVIGMAKEEV